MNKTKKLIKQARKKAHDMGYKKIKQTVGYAKVGVSEKKFPVLHFSIYAESIMSLLK